jgi:hypothetical protein
MVHKRKVVDIDLKIRLSGERAREWETGGLSLIDEISSSLEIPDVDIIIKGHTKKVTGKKLVEE